MVAYGILFSQVAYQNLVKGKSFIWREIGKGDK